MEVLSYLLPRPAYEILPEMAAAFNNLYQSTAPGQFIEYQLPYPKWQFLSYLCETKNLVLHGSQNTDIAFVEPRQANDVKQYSNQKAIYATTDGIWVMYFAILDRMRFPHVSLFNSCLQIKFLPDQYSDPFYFFSITHTVLAQKPWITGAIYILSRQSFSREPAQQAHGTEIIFPHWISTQAELPVAKLLVEPQDFPFLNQVHGHDDEKLTRLAAQNPDGFPWTEALDPVQAD